MIQSSKLFTMKISSTKLEDLKHEAAQRGYTTSAFVKHCIAYTLKSTPFLPKIKKISQYDKEKIIALNRINANINQIAKRCNSHERFVVLLELENISSLIMEYLDAH